MYKYFSILKAVEYVIRKGRECLDNYPSPSQHIMSFELAKDSCTKNEIPNVMGKYPCIGIMDRGCDGYGPFDLCALSWGHEESLNDCIYEKIGKNNYTKAVFYY